MMPKKSMRGMQFMGVGFELIAIGMGAIYIGQVIDEKYDTKGLATVGLLFVGVISWVFHLIMLLKAFQRNEAQQSMEEEK